MRYKKTFKWKEIRRWGEGNFKNCAFCGKSADISEQNITPDRILPHIHIGMYVKYESSIKQAAKAFQRNMSTPN
jgi:hypothetical protein